MLTLPAPRATTRLRLNVKGFNMEDYFLLGNNSIQGGESGRPSRTHPLG